MLFQVHSWSSEISLLLSSSGKLFCQIVCHWKTRRQYAQIYQAISQIRSSTVSWTLRLWCLPATNSHWNWVAALKKKLDKKQHFHADSRLCLRQTRPHRFAHAEEGMERSCQLWKERAWRLRRRQRQPLPDAQAEMDVTNRWPQKEHVVTNSLILAAMRIGRHWCY